MNALILRLALGLGIGAWGLGTLVVAQAQTASIQAETVGALPKDIDPQSLSRLPIVKRDDLKDEDDKRIYDMLAGGEGKTVGRDRSGSDFASEPEGGGIHPDAEPISALSWRAEVAGF